MAVVKRFINVMLRLRRIGLAEMPKLRQDLSISQMRTLKHIILSPGMHLQQIADSIGVTAPSMSVALKKLESGQWIYREEDPQDKRASLFHPSLSSKELFVEVKNMQKQNLQNFLSVLSVEEQDQLVSILEKALNNLEEQNSQLGVR